VHAIFQAKVLLIPESLGVYPLVEIPIFSHFWTRDAFCAGTPMVARAQPKSLKKSSAVSPLRAGASSGP